MKMKRRALSFLLSLAVMVTFMPMMTLSVSAASKGGKTYIVTKEKNAVGDTVSYKYNKKGLVSKKVEKKTEKDDESDKVTTVTTSYKYNKKSRASKKTVKTVESTTFYDTNKTTGKTTASRGTVTKTTTDVTKYTYKKGKATKAVTTSTSTMSGSVTTSDKSREYGEKELQDGRVLAGYNKYTSSGAYITKNTSANAYYYTGAVNDAVVDSVTTTTYRDNGNGTYTEISDEKETDYVNYDTENVYAYYKNGSPATQEDYDVRLITEVKVIPSAGGGTPDTSLTHTENVYGEKTVTTATFSYDKKKRVKAVKVTEMTTGTEVRGPKTTTETVYYNDSTEVTTTTDKTPYTEDYNETKSYVVKYSYDKKGHAKKEVESSDGVKNSSSVITYGLIDITSEVNTSYTDGSPATKDVYATTATGADVLGTTSIVAANGTKTTTEVSKAVTVKTTLNGAVQDEEAIKEETKIKNKALKAEPYTYTYTYKYDKSGNLKSSKSNEYDTYVKPLKNEVFGNGYFEFDADGEIQPVEIVVGYTSKDKSSSTNALKKGSKRLKSAVTIGLSKYDRESFGVDSYLSGKITYKLKAKKLSKKNAKTAELQQWIIQNGELNGIVGLY